MSQRYGGSVEAARPQGPLDDVEETRATRIAAARGGGSGLPADALGSMEAGFGTSLDDVRVHSDASAAELADDVDARAFAVGSDIFFGAGEFAPGTPGGQHLLAHEVAHTIQQRGSAGTAQAKLTVSSAGDASEREADAAADAIAAGLPAPALSASPPAIARERRSNETDWMQRSAGAHDDQLDPDYKKGIVAREYVQLHAPNLVHQTGVSLLECPLSLPEYLLWKAPARTFLIEMWEPVWAEQDRAWEVLAALLAPDRIIPVIDTGRDCAPNPLGTSDFRMPVAWELRKILSRRILERLPALAARWARAANQRQAAGVDRNPTADEVPPGHPIERLLLRGLNAAAALDAAAYRKAHAAESGGKGIASVRKGLKYRFTGGSTRTGQDWMQVIELLDPLDATREEVALELTGSTENAHTIEGAAPLYGVPDPLTPAARAQRDAQIGSSPVIMVTDDPKLKDRMALASAAGIAAGPGVAATEAGKLAVLQRMSLTIDEIGRCRPSAQKLGLDGIGAAARELGDRARELRGAPPADVVKWEAQSAAQLEIVQEAKAGLLGTGAYLDSFTADWPKARGLIERTVGAFDTAVRASSVITEGRYHLKYAADQRRLMEVDLMDLLLAELRRNLNKSMTDHTKLGVVDKSENQQLLGWDRLLRERSVRLRELALTDAPAFQAELARMRTDVSELSVGTTLQVNMDQCDLLWRQLYDSLSTVGVLARTNEDKKRGIRAVQTWGSDWNRLYIRWKSGDPAQRAAVKKEMEGLTAKGGAWEKLFADIRTILEDAADIEKWVSLGIMIGIALATGGIGAFAEIAGMGAIGVTITEAVVFTALSYAIMTNPEDASLGGFLKELAGNIVMFGALRMISMIYSGIVGKAAMQTLKGKAGLLVTQFTALNGYALFEAQTRKLAATGKNLTWGEVGEISLHNFVFMAAVTTGGALMRPGLEGMKLRGVTSRNIARVAGIKRQIGGLLDRMSSSKGADSQAAVEMIARQRELVEAEGRALAELEPIARDPKKAKRANLDLAEFERLKAEHAENLAGVEQAELMTAMEPGGTDTVFVRPDKMADARRHYTADPSLSVGDEAIDPLSGAKFFEVTPDQGTPFKVIEKLGDGAVSRPTEGGAPVASEADAARRAAFARETRDALKGRKPEPSGGVKGVDVYEDAPTKLSKNKLSERVMDLFGHPLVDGVELGWSDALSTYVLKCDVPARGTSPAHTLEVPVTFKVVPKAALMAEAGPHGADSGPARYTLKLDATAGTWSLEVRVSDSMYNTDVPKAAGHELREAGLIVVEHPTGADARTIAGEQVPGTFGRGAPGARLTPHDHAAYHELLAHFDSYTRASGPEKAAMKAKVERLLAAMGLDPRAGATADASMRARLDALLELDPPDELVSLLRPRLEAQIYQANVPAGTTSTMSPEVVQHIVAPEPLGPTAPTTFGGADGGHVTAEVLRSARMNNNKIAFVEEATKVVGKTTFRRYSQWRWKDSNPNPPTEADIPPKGATSDPRWDKGTYPKTTVDDVSVLTAEGQAAFDAWLGATRPARPAGDVNFGWGMAQNVRDGHFVDAAGKKIPATAAMSPSGFEFSGFAQFDSATGTWNILTVYPEGAWIP